MLCQKAYRFFNRFRSVLAEEVDRLEIQFRSHRLGSLRDSTSIWPRTLHYLTTLLVAFFKPKAQTDCSDWSGRPGSNRRHSAWESGYHIYLHILTETKK